MSQMPPPTPVGSHADAPPQVIFTPSPGQAENAPATPPKRRRWPVVVAIVVAFFIGMGVGRAGQSSPAPAAVGDSTSQGAEKAAGGKAAAAQPAAKHWVTVAKLTTSSDKDSQDFQLTGAPARMKYATASAGMGVYGIYLLTSGTDISTDGGIPIVSPKAGESDTTVVHRSAGSYYLHVTGTGRISVTIQEQR